MYFGSLDHNDANRQFVQWAAGVDKSDAAGNAQGLGVGLKNWGVGTAQGLWDMAKTVGSTNVVDQFSEGVEQWRFLLTDPEGYADAVKTQVGAAGEAMAQAAAQGYVDTRLNSLYGGYSGNVAVVTFGLFQILNPEEKVAVLVQLSREGKVAKLAELESDAAKAGKLDDYKSYQTSANEAISDETIMGGAHRDTSKPRNDGFDSHHCPAQSCYRDAPISSLDGPAIKMDPDDHVLTASYGRGPAQDAYRAKQRELLGEGKLMEAIQMDVDDIRSKFGNKYDKAIEQMMDYAKKMDPDQFRQ